MKRTAYIVGVKFSTMLVMLCFLFSALSSNEVLAANGQPCGGSTCQGNEICEANCENLPGGGSRCVGACASYGGGGGGFAQCPAGTAVSWTPSSYYCGAGMDVAWERPVGCCELTCMGTYCEGPDCDPDDAPECWCQPFKAYRQVGWCMPLCSAGTAPSLSLPVDTQIFSGPSGSASVDFSWTDPSSWGSGDSATSSRTYSLCVGANASDPCSGGSTYPVAGVNPATAYTASVPAGNKYWSVKATNSCGSTSPLATVRNVCIEGYTLPADNGVGNAYFSQWGACDANHIRTRTCTEDCGSDNCTAAVAAGLLQENCEGSIRGTIFDATDVNSCPSFDPATGYLVGVDTNLTANSREFVMTDQSSVSPHPWSPLSAVQTDSSGNYAVRVYAPANYVYDFTDLRDMYVVSSGPKLTCTSLVATVPGNASNCGTQPCSLVNNMSFGFDRYWGGWWQTVGAGVHAEDGLRSSIPSAHLGEQSLILGDGTASNRRGVASYGNLVGNMLGVNPNAKFSANLWQVESKYGGVIYDYAYFNQQFKKYSSTVWDGVSPISYDDNGSGYQIFKVAGPVANFNYSPTGTQKVIFLINGDVTINTNLVVPVGGYMAVIASGDITFETATTSVDGWFLAKNINVRCTDADTDLICDRTDVQFLGNGSFVGWSGINLRRDMGGASNIAEPAEKFTYRLDLYENAPEPMKIITKRYKPFVP